DAPALIRLIEQSPSFKHAAFDAPTTQTQGERGERFHIAAHADPVFTVQQ
ncbi:MAG: general secretion pathway protein GspL, partial [Hyphomicrobiales bacterium]|nr:general secretion pathway protein GspL [Hyphomicrobiales bacterium]